MNVRKLCKMIDMPDEAILEIENWNAEVYGEALEQYWVLVQDKSKWADALAEVKELLGDDENGLKCLAFMMQIGLRTYQEYLEKGISEQIYSDTLSCFSRFVREYYESFGRYGFDREWWTVRELTLKEFRLGELEYEMVEEADNRLIYVHIPSDARLEKQKRRESYVKARSFFADYASDYAETAYYCESWLLSPKLKELLTGTSNIISFQEDFIIDSYERGDASYMLWVFKNQALSLEEVPENTSLQRKMKEYLKNSGKIGAGRGYIKRELFE